MSEENNVSNILSSSSIWASMTSWFTPTVLFLLLNLMIGTIALSSTVANQKQKQPKKKQENQQLDKSPSVLQRLRSINFCNFRSHETLLFKSTPDSDTLYNLEESQSHFSFHHTHQESSNLETQATHYIFRQESHQEAHTHFSFQHENQSRFHFDQTREEKEEQKEAHFGSQKDAEEAATEELESMDEVYSRLKGRQVNRSKSDTKPSAGEMPSRLPEKMKKSASMKSPFNHFEEEEEVEHRRPATMRERGAEVDHEVDAKADDFINRFKEQLKMQRLESILRYKEMIGRGAGK